MMQNKNRIKDKISQFLSLLICLLLIAVVSIRRDGKVYYNKQIAPTVAKILGVKFEPNHPDAGKAITF